MPKAFDISKYAATLNRPMAAETRDIETITAEIIQLKQDAGTAILGIGQRLIEAKAILPHGEWLPWLEERVEFSERSAQNFMRLAREWSNPQALADLGASKALTLLALPPEERAMFMAESHLVDGEEKTVVDMTSRELEKAIKERDAARQEAEAAKADAQVCGNAWVSGDYHEVGTLEHIRALSKAEKDGRLVVLPCKVGDTVYEIDLPKYGIITCKALEIHTYFGPLCHTKGNPMVSTVTVSVEVIDGHGKGSGYTFQTPDFGENVFLAREEAEAALKKGRRRQTMTQGDKVVMNDNYHVSEADKGKVWVVISEPWNCCGTMVVKLEGKSGGYAVDGLNLAEGTTEGLGGPRHSGQRRCSLFRCAEREDYICCADCERRPLCFAACQNDPPRCGLEDRKRKRANEHHRRTG